LGEIVPAGCFQRYELVRMDVGGRGGETRVYNAGSILEAFLRDAVWYLLMMTFWIAIGVAWLASPRVALTCQIPWGTTSDHLRYHRI